ncbi:Ser/Thr protein phosphatase [Tritrichomonas foetus]|uniref:Serine/threonine-protein phosphatase n=1 Tax=Tritrichomonas foetus TaxID=1144522 RepID=A0A1J4K230_9EUKA|nr:Ser/Thr protein phosphatase [Tritrichomonas foetus]|eukprot:OHT05497.1 Ser/Thr protein phosphatase [Tritrichomonas foetus]
MTQIEGIYIAYEQAVMSTNKLLVPVFASEEIEELLISSKKIFHDESILLHLEGEFIIVGDLHGHLFDLYRILKTHGFPPNQKYIFLGDLIDRGEFSLATVTLIFVMKCKYPENVYVIRGNHEFSNICENSGFKSEISYFYDNHLEDIPKLSHFVPPLLTNQENHKLELFPSNCSPNSPTNISKSKTLTTEIKLDLPSPNSIDTQKIFDLFIDAFSELPLAIHLKNPNGDIFCVHGGIGPKFQHISQMDRIVKPIYSVYGGIADEILWSDPSDEILTFCPSKRGIGHHYGHEATKQFLDRNNLRILIRGHQSILDGCEYSINGLVLTIFSASNYCNQINSKSGICIVKNDKIEEIVIFEPQKFIMREEATFMPSISRQKEIDTKRNKEKNELKYHESKPLFNLENASFNMRKSTPNFTEKKQLSKGKPVINNAVNLTPKKVTRQKRIMIG